MKRKILIINDKAEERAGLLGVLEREYAVVSAESYTAALSVLNISGIIISAVVLNVDFQDNTGFEFIKKVRQNVIWTQIPIIVVTYSEDEKTQVKAISLGVNNYFVKPNNLSLLLSAIDNCIKLKETAAIINSLQRDKLTGLYNRKTFLAEVKRHVGRHEAGYYTISSLNIDSFKYINDQYGTENGDSVLKYVADCVAEYVDDINGIACRATADKYAVMLPTKALDSDRSRDAIKKACSPNCIKRGIKIRIGRYLVDDLSLSASSMLDRATLAEESIRGGYDIWVANYNEDMRMHLLREQRITSEMNEALRTGQFEPWFQPQFNHLTGAMIGAEVLVRWRHSRDRRLILPGEFIPVFERNGFIYELDKYVWEKSCVILRDMLDRGENPLPLSVNISRFDVFHDNFIEVITGLTQKYDIPVELLRLEITESAFAKSTEHIVYTFKKLIDLGYTVEIDDFGSGYSSLNTLKDVPASVLKLDMRFLESSTDSPRSGNILESVVRMAKWLGMSVIAEGVEMREQADYLRSIGCYYVQGYLYAKPMPLSDFKELLKNSTVQRRLEGLETVETLDNNAFWDPKSMDTLIFNSYVGGACIFEYHNGKTELLRVNDRYTDEFDIKIYDGKPFSELNPTNYLDEKNLGIMLDNITNAIKTQKESSCEITWVPVGRDENEPIVVRSTVRVIARAGDRYLLYCVLNNITSLRQAQWKEHSLSERIQAILDHTDSGIAAVAMNPDGSINYVFFNNKYYQMLGYTPEQYASEVKGPWDLIIPEDYTRLYPIIKEIGKRDNSTVFEMRAKRRDGQIVWLRAAISIIELSDIAYPVQLTCFTDINDVKERDNKLQYLNDTMLNLMNRTPGAFVQMRVMPDGIIRAEFCNDGYFELIGMNRETARFVFKEDVLAGVHPDDVGLVRETVKKMLTLGEAHNVRCRLRHGTRDYIWVMVSGQMTKDSDGKTILNAYYTDATEQVNEEEKQKELLDNLPYGAGLYEFDGEELKVVHLNRRYWELVGRRQGSNVTASFIESVHPNDRQIIIDAILDAINNGGDSSCDARIVSEDGKYNYFHIAGRVIRREDGKYSIYAAHTPLSDEAVSIQEMLPVALKTLMETQTDYSFVKDKNGRYICCSSVMVRSRGLDSDADIIGKTDYEIFDSKTAQEYSEGDRRVFETGEPLYAINDTFIDDEGQGKYFSTSKYPLKDSHGNIIGIYGLGRDVTEDRAMKSQLEILTNNIPGGIGIYEEAPESPAKVKLTYFSDGLCKLFGYSREEYKILSDDCPLCLIFSEDLPAVTEQILRIMQGDTPIDCVFRASVRGGGFKWINLKAVVGKTAGDKTCSNIIMTDVTEQQETLERLRISEEESHLAIRHSACIICTYSLRERTAKLLPDVAKAFDVPDRITNIPYGPIEDGLIAPESKNTYLGMYADIHAGKRNGFAIYKKLMKNEWRWTKASYSTILNDSGEPVSAVISYFDVTEELEKEAVYKKWQQSLNEKNDDSYTLFRCNLNKETCFDSVMGSLLKVKPGADKMSFSELTRDYAEHYVYDEDREKYCSFVNSDVMLASYYKGKRLDKLEYREMTESGDVRWLRLSVDLVEFPNSTDIEAYLMYENIDAQKKAEQMAWHLAENDPLTGVLNRKTFNDKVCEIIESTRPGTQHAFLMLDLDGFKLLNDSFGHAAGDDALVETAHNLQSILRHSDVLGRLGGDEFVIFLYDIASDANTAKKAEQMCSLLRKTYSVDVGISTSIGISVFPRDGVDAKTLYKKADAALYDAKNAGKNSYKFYGPDTPSNSVSNPKGSLNTIVKTGPNKKRRMLIVDDNSVDRDILANIFKDDFIIDKAFDGQSALIRMRHYGTAISVVLLDLVMSGTSGLDVLERMRSSQEMSGIPVIVVSGDGSRETMLNVIKCGASDFVIKPVDMDILRLRVESAISRAENERLRAQNSFLQLRSEDTSRYQSAMSRMGYFVVEIDWIKNAFSYDPTISKYIKGTYDSRSFWQILLSDMAADVMDVKAMQSFVHKLSDDRMRTEDSITVPIRTPGGEKQNFRIRAYKTCGSDGLTSKMSLIISKDNT